MSPKSALFVLSIVLIALFLIVIPSAADASYDRHSQATSPTPIPPPTAESGVLRLPLDITISTADPVDQAILVGMVFSAVMILWFLSLLLRIFFRRPLVFGAWQPPYVTMPPLDADSTYGRRQAWQQYARDNLVPLPCQAGGHHARKMLLGTDGRYLSGWRIMALRLNQYDQYGRVSRSQVMASKKAVKRLNRLARKSETMEGEAIARRVRPLAKPLAKRLSQKLNSRNAMLAIALDVRLRGVHGEVRIVFELYECPDRQPRLLDRWEPEMTVMGRTIYEVYTFTIPGQRGNESVKVFRKRLETEVERALVNLLCAPIVFTPSPPLPTPLSMVVVPTPAITPPPSEPEIVEAPESDETVHSDANHAES